ncbi:MAG: glycosyltransferase family 4 protein [Actinobacteria bacterium]|nr:glycosyltransferase family 4 protein [Actinomycetota bacterium]
MRSRANPTRPPILIAGAFLSGSTGIRFVCEDLAAGLEARGWTITTTSRIENRWIRLIDMVGTALLSRRRYRLAQVDVYSGPAFIWAEIVTAVLSLLRCPYILTLHSGALPEFAERHPKRVSRLLRSAAAVTSPSSFLQRQLGDFRSDIRVIRNGLYLDRYPARMVSPARPKLVWIRAFEDRYNPLLALQVAKRLSDDNRDVELLMAGPNRGGITATQVANEAERLGLKDRVKIRGAVPKELVPSVLQEGDIFLNTTNVDNAPVIVVEAMACGSCVVSTDAGGVPDLVTDGEDSLLVPCDDAEAMAHAVARILDDPDLARMLSTGAREKAEDYAWDRVLSGWEDLLTQVHRSHRAAGQVS